MSNIPLKTEYLRSIHKSEVRPYPNTSETWPRYLCAVEIIIASVLQLRAMSQNCDGPDLQHERGSSGGGGPKRQRHGSEPYQRDPVSGQQELGAQSQCRARRKK